MGFWTLHIAQFVFVIFVVLLVVIILYFFKLHITQTTVDYYLWSKQYDIPMALFSVDIENQSSIIVLNKIYYWEKENENLKRDLIEVLDKWFGKVYYYNFTFGKVTIIRENFESKQEGSKTFIRICGPQGCTWIEVKAMKILGKYPLPIVYNNSDTGRLIELTYSSLIPK